jgi:hypothetical protein
LLGSTLASAVTVLNGGYFNSGKLTAASTTSGFYLGFDSSVAKLHVGNATKAIYWDGTNLSLNGQVVNWSSNIANIPTTLSNTLAKSGADILTGPITMNTAGAILVGSLTDGMYIGNTGIFGKKAGSTTFSIDAAGNATFAGELSAATGTFAGSLSAATGSFSGSLTAATGTLGALTIASGGNIKQGQTAFNTGTGFWIGDVAGVAKFSIGNPAGNSLTWDGTTLAITGSATGTIIDTRNYVSGTVPICSDNSTGTIFSTGKTANTFYTVKSMYTVKAGTLTVSFDYQRSATLGPNWQVALYVNGVQTGTLITSATASAATWFNLSQTITVTAGGTVDVRVSQQAVTNGFQFNIRNFIARNNFVTINAPVTTTGSYE